jgi:hypothetical protein
VAGHSPRYGERAVRCGEQIFDDFVNGRPSQAWYGGGSMIPANSQPNAKPCHIRRSHFSKGEITDPAVAC